MEHKSPRWSTFKHAKHWWQMGSVITSSMSINDHDNALCQDVLRGDDMICESPT